MGEARIRGADRREPIFTGDEDRQLYLATLGEVCEKTDCQIHAWCLMSNHFHLVLETPRGNLVEGMQWLLGVLVLQEQIQPRKSRWRRKSKKLF